MTSANTIRYLAAEAARCHGLSLAHSSESRDAHEVLCLLFPAVMEALELQPMDEWEQKAFKFDFHEKLKRQRELKLMRHELNALQLQPVGQ
jgi:hypothetical protein